jgi:hypothetical protein
LQKPGAATRPVFFSLSPISGRNNQLAHHFVSHIITLYFDLHEILFNIP